MNPKYYFSNIKQYWVDMTDKITDKLLDTLAKIDGGSRDDELEKKERYFFNKRIKYKLDTIKEENPQLSKKELSDIASQLKKKIEGVKSFDTLCSSIDRFEYRP